MIPQTDIAYYYQLGQFFVSASQSETQGLTYIEALASGVPLLCRKDECLNNVVIEGKNGFQYTNDAEFEKYFGSLLNLSKEEYKAMSSFAQKKAEETFSSSAFCDKILECYNKALEKPVHTPYFKDLYYRFSKAIPFI